MWKPAFYSLLFSMLVSVFAWDVVSAKGLLPERFREVQSQALVILLVLAGLITALYFALRGFFRSERYRALNLLFGILAIAPIVGGLYYVAWMQGVGHRYVLQAYQGDRDILRKISEASLGAETPEKRKAAAHGAYLLYDIQLAYSAGGGSVTGYVPDAKEQAEHAAFQGHDIHYQNAVAYHDDLLTNIPGNLLKILTGAGCYFVLLLAIDFVIPYLKRNRSW